MLTTRTENSQLSKIMVGDIENHPFELSSNPYVIWRYYTLRKIFVFLDRTGFGDYQLMQDYYDQEWR